VPVVEEEEEDMAAEVGITVVVLSPRRTSSYLTTRSRCRTFYTVPHFALNV